MSQLFKFPCFYEIQTLIIVFTKRLSQSVMARYVFQFCADSVLGQNTQHILAEDYRSFTQSRLG